MFNVFGGDVVVLGTLRASSKPSRRKSDALDVSIIIIIIILIITMINVREKFSRKVASLRLQRVSVLLYGVDVYTRV